VGRDEPRDACEWRVLVTFVVVLAVVLGALIGSFLNVVVYRVPAGKSVVSPPSACGNCGHRIRWYDNVPVVSWLVLRGKCRDCGDRISVRYPLVEAGTAVAFGLIGAGFAPQLLATTTTLGAISALLVLVAYLYLAAVSIALALIDLDVHRLPNTIVLPGYAVGIALLVPAALLAGEPHRLLPAAVGLAAMFLAYLAMALAYPGGMGLGDVKLAGVLGLFTGWLGWGPLAVGAIGAFILGGIFSGALLLARRAGRKSGIPFGPWMLMGAWVGIALGEPIAAWYLGLFGLS
jgi:prepilin signal peptidase PulO-like enzyme (type II secretory pathway)